MEKKIRLVCATVGRLSRRIMQMTDVRIKLVEKRCRMFRGVDANGEIALRQSSGRQRGANGPNKSGPIYTYK